MQQRTRPLRVLVIDDKPENRNVVIDLLSLYGITEVAAGNDRQARELVAQFHPDVAVIDVAMPHEDGTQIAAWIKHEYPEIRVVIYTAFTRVGAMKLAIDAVGPDAFLQKPFDMDDLYKAIVGA